MGSVYVDRRSGRPIFSLAYKDVDGRPRRERTKALTRGLARRLLAMKEDHVELARVRGLASVDDLSPAPVPTFKSFVEKTYLPHVKVTKAPGTYHTYERVLRVNIVPKLGGKALDCVRPADIQALLDGRTTEAHDAPRTIVQAWGILSGVFRAAIARDLIGKNPARGSVCPRVEESAARCLTKVEVAALLSKASPALSEIIRFALGTALRDSEIRHLTWADYDRGNAALAIRKTKAHRDRIVPLSPAAHAIIETREAARGLPAAATDPHVFLNPNTRRGWKFHFTCSREWRDLLAAAGVQARFHDLRHTGITGWVVAGHPLDSIRRIAGHATIAQTSRYCHPDGGDLRAVVDGPSRRHDQTPPASFSEAAR